MTVEVTDLGPKNNTVCRIANLPKAISYPPTYAVYTNKGLISCGGFSKKCYTLETNGSWVPFHDRSQWSSFFSMTILNEKIVVIGRWSSRKKAIEYMNIKNGSKWENETLPFELTRHCAVAINESTIMIIGGTCWYAGEERKVFRPSNL